MSLQVKIEKLIYTYNKLLIMSLINISDYVKAKLEGKKKEEQHKSLDSVIRVLLEREGGNEK